MGQKTSVFSDDFLREYAAWARHLEETHDALIELRLRCKPAGTRPARILIELTGWARQPSRLPVGTRESVRVWREWPTKEGLAGWATICRLLMDLDEMMEEGWPHD